MLTILNYFNHSLESKLSSPFKSKAGNTKLGLFIYIKQHNSIVEIFQVPTIVGLS